MSQCCDEIEYRIIGQEMQAVIVTLDPAEQVLAEAGSMLYMTEGIDMQTSLDPSATRSSIFGGVFKGMGRMFTGESFFITTFTNRGKARADVAFSAPYPGKILPINMEAIGGRLLCQKDAFLCAARGTEISVAFQKKLGTGFFGGEGFILQCLEGDGLCFVHAGGTVFEIELTEHQPLRIDTGSLVAFQPSVDYDVEWVGGVTNALFGGEGFFFATLQGPGKVYLQTLPISRLADRLASARRRLL
jgi:uncharacterized protein (TIGR00266 family)